MRKTFIILSFILLGSSAMSQSKETIKDVIKILNSIDSNEIKEKDTLIIIMIEDSVFSSLNQTSFYINGKLAFLLASKSELFMKNIVKYYLVSKFSLSQEMYYLMLVPNVNTGMKKNIEFRGVVK